MFRRVRFGVIALGAWLLAACAGARAHTVRLPVSTAALGHVADSGLLARCLATAWPAQRRPALPATAWPYLAGRYRVVAVVSEVRHAPGVIRPGAPDSLYYDEWLPAVAGELHLGEDGADSAAAGRPRWTAGTLIVDLGTTGALPASPLPLPPGPPGTPRPISALYDPTTRWLSLVLDVGLDMGTSLEVAEATPAGLRGTWSGQAGEGRGAVGYFCAERIAH